MSKKWIVCVLSACFLAAGCAPTLNVTLGEMPSRDPGASIEAGMTTKAEVLEMFGVPDLKGVDADGLPMWTWTRGSLRVVKAKDAALTSFFNLEVSFDGEIVKSYSFSRKAQ